MVGKNGEEDVGVQPLHFGIRRQIHDVVGIIRDAEVAVQLVERGQEVGGTHMAALRALDFGAVVPRDHDEQNHHGEQHREPAAVHELCSRSKRRRTSSRSSMNNDAECDGE
jgi:hypothetical protein